MVEQVQFLKSTFYKNVTNQGGAQAHAIKNCPQGHIVLARCNDTHQKLWGSMTPANYLNTISKKHNLFEIITTYPHKVYFDIDGKQSDDFPKYIQEVKNKIISYFPNAEMALSGSNDGKASIHVVLQNYMMFNDFQRSQVKQIATQCEFDCAVYTKNRLMKCVNQSKTDGRIQSTLENEDLKSHCITNFFTEPLPFPSLPAEIIEQVNIQSAAYFDFGSLPKITYKSDLDIQDITPQQVLDLFPCTQAYKFPYNSSRCKVLSFKWNIL